MKKKILETIYDSIDELNEQLSNEQQLTKLTLPRLDTNDIPKDKNSITNIWYTKA